MQKAMLFLILLFTVGQQAMSQTYLKEGSLDFLKSNQPIAVEFTYQHTNLNEAGAEATFVSNKTASLNQRKEGWGNRWQKRWKSHKFCHFQPRFMTRLIQQTQRSSLQFTPDPSQAAYKMVVNVDYIHRGFNYLLLTHAARLQTTINVVDMTTNETVAVIKSEAYGRVYGYDFESKMRIKRAYAYTGKDLGAYLAKAS